MGDCPRAGRPKPSWYVTRRLGQLSLPSLGPSGVGWGYTDSRSAIQKLAKTTGKEEIVHHVLSPVEQIAAGGNAQMTFQWIPGYCGIEGNMLADSVAKDASTLPQTAAPVDFSTAKTVIRHHCARKWSGMAKPAVHHAT